MAVFAAVELLSPLPAFHRHANEAEGVVRAQIRPAGSLAKSNPNCPACAILGMSALASFGPAARISSTSVPAVARCSVTSPFRAPHSIDRDRAPPSL
jgi:hypothetical protein